MGTHSWTCVQDGCQDSSMLDFRHLGYFDWSTDHPMPSHGPQNSARNQSFSHYRPFDFTVADADTSGWVEMSDTRREVGMSKAVFPIQKTQVYQRAVFFALLNPQPSGAGFAGVDTEVKFNLSQCTTLDLRLRAGGEYSAFKVTLYHKSEEVDVNYSYEQFFQGPREFQVVRLLLADFKAYFRGFLIEDAEPLDTSDITRFGLQFMGGFTEGLYQSGPATLEVDWIKCSG